jgi:uncharacterized protein (TIGR02996 family)
MAETLDSALASFQKTRSAAITAAIVALGRAAPYTPQKSRKNIEFHRAWLAAVADPYARTWCLDNLTTKLPKLLDGKEHFSGDTCVALEQRLKPLVKVSPDPRIAHAMLARFELREPVIGFVLVHKLMVKLIALHADDSTAEAVTGVGLPPELRKLKLPKPVKLAAKEAARWAVSAPAAPNHAGVLARDVGETPDDDTARAVLADSLQEQGDPRGEFITIQLQEARGEATDEAIARAAALVKEHGKTWLGTLRPIIYRAEFRRGFLARIELAGSWSSSKWETHVKDPALATVEEIEQGQGNSALVAKFVASPIVRANLRAIEIGANDVWAAVIAAPLPKLARVSCFGWKRGNYEQRFTADVLPWIERTASIVELGCEFELASKLPKRIVDRLVAFECRADLEDAVALWQNWPHLQRLVCNWSARVELVRDGDKELARVRPTTFFRDDGSFLRKLPEQIVRLEVIGNAAFYERAQWSIGNRFELVPRPLPSGLVTGTKA